MPRVSSFCLVRGHRQKQGADLRKLNGTIQNDILKEYAARGTYIYPPKPSMRITDIFSGAAKKYLSGTPFRSQAIHIREAGSTRRPGGRIHIKQRQGICGSRTEKGLDINVFSKRLSFSLMPIITCSRKLPNSVPPGGCGPGSSKDMGATGMKGNDVRFHTQTGGSTPTAQQPMNNISRVTVQTLAAVMGGTQSLHTNGYDEALSLPTEEAARIALRTQQIVAFESGAADTADPLAGSYYVESPRMPWSRKHGTHSNDRCDGRQRGRH